MSDYAETLYTIRHRHERTELDGAGICSRDEELWPCDSVRLLALLDRPTPTLSDAALVEEAARRGMTVMDAAEAARLRGVEAEVAEPLSQRVLRVAYIAGWNEYVREQGDNLSLDADDVYDEAWHATNLRALLSADDEAVG